MKTFWTLLLSTVLVIGLLGVDSANAQAVGSPANSFRSWRQSSPGMSSNAALAFYRVQNAGGVRRTASVPAPVMPRGRTLYSAPYYSITNRRTVVDSPTPSATSVTRTAQASKPFDNLQRPPNAVQRYWPLLLQGQEDQNTGLVIWTLP